MATGLLKSRGHRSPTLWTVLVVAAAAMLLSGCLEDNSSCSDPFDQVVPSDSVQNKNEVDFNISDFAFLADPNLKIESVSLSGNVIPHHAARSDFEWSFNGVKCDRDDGGHNLDLDCGTASHDSTMPDGQDRDDDHNVDKTETRAFCSQPDKFSLNGGVSFLRFLSQIQINKGVVRLAVHGRDTELVSANLEFKGVKYKTCPVQNPPPPPPPTAPTTTIGSYTPNAAETNVTSMTVNFSADQTGVTFYCSLDGATAAACTSPANYSGLANGQHTFSVYAQNSAGLKDANPPTITWTVDTTPPNVTITNLSSLPTLTNSTSISVQFSSSEAVTFSCSLDGATAAACTSPVTYSGLAEGTHTFSVSDVDPAGNVSTNPATFQWTVDLTPPTASIVSATPSSPDNNSTTMVVQFSANESSTYMCTLDSGAAQSCSSPFTMDNLAEGGHIFSVQATDLAGNVGVAVTYGWTTDLTPPVITLGNIVPTPGVTNGADVSVGFTTSKTSTVTCSFDGATAAACTSPFTTTVTVEGPHSLVLSATDVAGNVSAPVTVNWTMDFTAPTLAFGVITPSANAYINQNNVSVQIMTSADQYAQGITLTATLNGTSLGTVTSPITLTGLADGPYALVVSAVDSAGNVGQSIEHDFTVDTVPPVLTANAAITGLTNKDTNTLTFSANEPSTFTCNVDSAGYAACTSPLTLSGLADGQHEVDILATDLAGNVSTAATLIWTVDTTPPVTTLSATETGANIYTITLTSNEANSTFTCSVDGASPAPCNSPVTEGQGLTVGSHTFTAYATDAAGNTDPKGASYTIVIAPPTTAISATQTGRAAFTFTFTSSAANATFQCALDGAALASCPATDALSGISTGNHTMAAYATDSGGNTDPTGASYSFTVQAPPTTTITGENPTPNLVNGTYLTNKTSISFTFASNQAGTFQCSMDGATPSPCSSGVSYTGLASAVHTFKVQAVDTWGDVDPTGASYSWQIDTTPPALGSITLNPTTNSMVVTWTTSKPTTTGLNWGKGTTTGNVIAQGTTYSTTHSVTVGGLTSSTLYSFQPTGTDQAGNALPLSTFTKSTK